jgi:hypothetical protein
VKSEWGRKQEIRLKAEGGKEETGFPGQAGE